MECVTAGQLNQDGPCTLFTKVNDNGIVLFECSDVTYTPADCPDDPAEGTFAVGPAVVKIASVDGTVPDVLVQRASDGSAWATKLGLDNNPCDHLNTLIQARIVNIGNGDGALDPGVGAIASTLRLRGHGDLVAEGGTEGVGTVGFIDIIRRGTQDGITEYVNTGTGNNEGHLFRIFDIGGVTYQELMLLEPAGGTLYFPAWTYVSDIRLKADVAPLEGAKALAVVLGIEPISYAMQGKRYHGFSAQNVGTVLPDAVSDPATKDRPMTMRDGDILANLVAAVKFLTARVEALEAKAGA